MRQLSKRRKARNRKILLAVLSACTVILWALVISALINAPSDIYQASNIPLASQQTIATRKEYSTLETNDKPVQVASIVDLEMETATAQVTVVPAYTPTLFPTPSSTPSPTQSPTAIPTQTPTATPVVLKVGTKGEAVEKLQQRLVDLGYLSETPDGLFGKSTKAAVKDFQKYSGLTIDGIAGTTTISELFSDTAIYKPSEIATPEKQTLKSGSTAYVWITSGGKKYHKNSSCSHMKSPKKVTLQDAIDAGYTACAKCY